MAQEFADKLQMLRKERGLTQEQLAQRLFVSRTAISKWESGRGYPGIDSLVEIAKFFSISVDELLSGDELVRLAKSDGLEKALALQSRVFGAVDCMALLLLFLPVFSQKTEEFIYSVSLFEAAPSGVWIKAVQASLLSLAGAFGAIELALCKWSNKAWQKHRFAASLLLSILTTLFFIASGEPYAATFAFFLLIIKGAVLLKRR